MLFCVIGTLFVFNNSNKFSIVNRKKRMLFHVLLRFIILYYNIYIASADSQE